MIVIQLNNSITLTELTELTEMVIKIRTDTQTCQSQ